MTDYRVFVHRATEPSGNSTYINDPFVGRPGDMLIVTPNWNPHGSSGRYNNHAIGVGYDMASRRWSIFNQDGEDIPVGAAFNVAAFRADAATAFIHRASQANTVGAYTYLYHQLVYRQPDIMMAITANLNPGGSGGVYNDHIIGVWYDPMQGTWAIFNEDLAQMPVGTAFNVHVSEGSIHHAVPKNSYGHYTYLEIPDIESRPEAVVLATPNLGAASKPGNHPIGVWYDGRRWSIFNQDFAEIASGPLPVGSAFNVQAWDAPGVYHEARSLMSCAL